MAEIIKPIILDETGKEIVDAIKNISITVEGKNGLPQGGLANQILAKKSDADYDTEWIDNIGQVESVNGKTGQVTLTAEDVGATTEQWVNQQNYLKSIPSEYVTETELNAKGYLTEHQDISNLATKAEVPTKTSQLINDSNFLTEHQDLTGYATEVYVDNKVSEIDLSGYALKTEIPTVPTNVSAFNNDVGYLTEIPTEYVTETELESKGYLTEHQSLANYSTTEEMNNAISNHHDSTKQDKLTAGSNITIENNVISATGGGSGGGANADEATIVTNAEGKLETAIGGKWVDGLVDGPTIVEITVTSNNVSSQITYDVMQTLINTDNLRATLDTGFGQERGCLVDIDTSTADTYILTCNYTITTVKIQYIGIGTADNWTCTRSFVGGSAGFSSTGNNFYSLVPGKVPSPINSAEFLPLSNDFKVVDGKLANRFLVRTSKGGYYLTNNVDGSDYKDVGENSFAVGAGNTNARSDNSYAFGSNVGTSSSYTFMAGNQVYGEPGSEYSIGFGMILCTRKPYQFVTGNYNNWFSSITGEGTQVFGIGNNPTSDWSMASGKWSVNDTDKQYARIIGNGTDNNNRSNAYTLDWSGNGTFAGTVSS